MNDLERIEREYAAFAFKEMVRDREYQAKLNNRMKESRKQNAKDNAKIVGAGLGMAALVFGVFWGILVMCGAFDEDYDHYNKDFATFCAQLHGKAVIDDRDLCLGPSNTILMWEHDGSEDDHYNKDFARFCTARGGSATVGIAHDVCVKDNRVIMREGKY